MEETEPASARRLTGIGAVGVAGVRMLTQARRPSRPGAPQPAAGVQRLAHGVDARWGSTTPSCSAVVRRR